MKSTIPWLIAAIAGCVVIAAYFIPAAQSWQDEAGQWYEVLAAVAFVLGGANLCLQNLQKISARDAGWGYAAVTLITFCITLCVGMFKVGVPVEDPATPWAGPFLAEGSALWWLFEYGYNPLTATMFALLAFYVASAAFRAFRLKNTEATLLLLTALVVLLGRTYAGTRLTQSVPDEYSALTFPGLTTIIMGVFNTSGQRAIMIGIALGVAATSLKVLLGVNRSYLGSGEG
ncbi:MAG: hypothetical protein EHM42_06610 [Planctomycetaceae bacterium]|nr:MAG: hypothetical protein EHM42_06610 [Planctomycetaceae bacterium]